MEDGKNRGESIPHMAGSSLALGRAVAFLVFAALFLASALVAQQQSGGGSEELLDRLEWRGVMALPGEVRFSLHDKAGQGSFWIGLDEIRSGVEVVSYDPEENQVTLRHGEATRTLSMSSATVLALAEQPSPPPVPPSISTGTPPEPGEQQPLDAAARERLDGLWQKAMEQSFNVREIDQAARALNREKGMLEETIAMTPPENSQLEDLVARQNELLEKERGLVEGALMELQNTGLGQEGQELSAGLRAGFLSHLAPPQQDDGGP